MHSETFIPPEGINFSTGTLPAAVLARALLRVAVFIQEIEPHGARLHKYHDWWEHDGCHFSKGPITVHELFQMVESPRNLLAAMPGDDAVFIGIAPVANNWYLRFYVDWDEEGFELLGRFDVTLPSNAAAQFRDEVLSTLELEIREQDAAAHYGSLYR